MGENQLLPKRDLAKYPFMAGAVEYVRPLALKIEDLSSPEYHRLLNVAENRIKEALSNLRSFIRRPLENYEVEISSFPMAVMIVAATNDASIKGSYALAEAKRVYELLKLEDKAKIIKIARSFNWKIRLIKDIGTYNFALHFVDFLKNAKVLHAKEWKLVNRILCNGEIYLTKHDVARLLQEEVCKHIERKLNIKERLTLPQNVSQSVERLKRTFTKKTGKARLENLPKKVVITAFPPCIRVLYGKTASGLNLSHIGRFTLTSFLINVGMSVMDIVNLFRSLSDFNERTTRYQVEHIAGGRGSRTKYIPPRCNTLRTHGVCPGINDTCKKIRHPLACYRKNVRKTP